MKEMMDKKTMMEMWRVFQKVRVMSLKRKPHIKAYIKANRLHGEVGGAMVDYYYDGKFKLELGADTEGSGTKPREIHVHESTFDPDTREGLNGLMELLVYKTATNARCITEEFLEKHKYRTPEKVEMLQSMLESRAGLFEITGTDSDEGRVFLREVFTGNEQTITEMSLSGNDYLDDLYVYTRIITYRGVSFNSGLFLMFQKADPFVANFLLRHKKDYAPRGELSRFMELYNYHAKSSNKPTMVVNPLP